MLDKQLARKLAPVVNNPEVWEPLKEYLQKAKTLELRVLAVATSELELYRSQGRLNSLERLEQLKDSVRVEMERKDEKA
jgi:hypothetical protein